MREYGKVHPTFWTGKTGRLLRGNREAQIVAMYLMTCPHATMIGVFHCPLAYIVHDTGLPLQGASKGLRSLSEAGFCTFDEDRDLVWVHEMARFQISDALSASDNRVKSTAKEFMALPMCLIKQGFHDRYAAAFHLPALGQNASPFEGASKGLRSQEQEQEQELSVLSGRDATPTPAPKPKREISYTDDFEAFWSDYPRTPTMSKKQAFAEWRKLDASDRMVCRSAVPAFREWLKAQKPDYTTLHAVRFISQRRFEGFTAQPDAPASDADWSKRLGLGRHSKQWDFEQWGPAPGEAGSRVPVHLLQPSDGQGWSQWRVA